MCSTECSPAWSQPCGSPCPCRTGESILLKSVRASLASPSCNGRNQATKHHQAQQTLTVIFFTMKAPHQQNVYHFLLRSPCKLYGWSWLHVVLCSMYMGHFHVHRPYTRNSIIIHIRKHKCYLQICCQPSLPKSHSPCHLKLVGSLAFLPSPLSPSPSIPCLDPFIKPHTSRLQAPPLSTSSPADVAAAAVLLSCLLLDAAAAGCANDLGRSLIGLNTAAADQSCSSCGRAFSTAA